MEPLVSNMKYTEERPWGKFTVLHETPKCKVKEIVVKPGEKLSYQYHEYRAERWVIIQGEATITIDDYDMDREAGEAIFIPRGAKHRIWNTGDETASVSMTVEEMRKELFESEDVVMDKNNDHGLSRLAEAGAGAGAGAAE